MANLEYAQLLKKIDDICDESRKFSEDCKNHIQASRTLCDHATQQAEELMILKEESIAAKCESLEILKISSRLSETGKLIHTPSILSGISDDTLIALRMLAEVEQAMISNDTPALNKLRTHFLSLSFLPE